MRRRAAVSCSSKNRAAATVASQCRASSAHVARDVAHDHVIRETVLQQDPGGNDGRAVLRHEILPLAPTP